MSGDFDSLNYLSHGWARTPDEDGARHDVDVEEDVLVVEDEEGD